MSKFKVGDKVRCIEESNHGFYGEVGKIYTVIEKYNMTIKCYGYEDTVDSCRFELVEEDLVNKPSHYTQGKIEVLSFIEDQNLSFHESQVLKYVVRAKHKGNELIDLKKAQFYLNRKIKLLEEKV